MKRGEEKIVLIQANEDKMLLEEKNCFINEAFLTNLMVATKQKFGTETQNMRKEEKEKNTKKAIKLKQQRETPWERNNGDTEQPEKQTVKWQ